MPRLGDRPAARRRADADAAKSRRDMARIACAAAKRFLRHGHRAVCHESHAGGADRFSLAVECGVRISAGARSPDGQVDADSDTPATWPGRAQGLASAASACVCVTRSLAASCGGAPRRVARRRGWSSGSLAVACATSASSGEFGSSPGSHRPADNLQDVLARPLVSRPLVATPERRDAGARGRETSEAAGGDLASLQCLGGVSAR
jgi:hypothetical protein